MPGRNGGTLKRGNPGNKGGGTYPNTYRKFLKYGLKSQKHRDAFIRALEDDQHPQFMNATKHAAEHAYKLPTQRVEHSGPDGKPIEQVWVFGGKEIRF